MKAIYNNGNKMMIALAIILLLFMYNGNTQRVSSVPTKLYPAGAVIYADENDVELVQKSAALLQQDIFNISGKKPKIVHRILSLKPEVF